MSTARDQPLAGSEASEPSVLIEVENGIGFAILNRPDHLNAMNVALMYELRGGLERLAGDPAVRCVVLRGAGRAFCAGGDVSEIAERRAAAARAPSQGALIETQTRTMIWHTASIRLLHEMPKPTVAVVHGHAVGGGMALALACDIRNVAETARLRVGFAPHSLSGDFGISYLLTHIVGGARARELMMLDPVIDGAEAGRLGLATAVHPDADLADAGARCARQLADGPTIALGRMKDNLLAAETERLEQVLQLEAINQRVSANTADAAEARSAAAARRPPRFTGT